MSLKMETQDAGTANGHIGIAGKIAVDLQGVGQYGQPDRA